MEETINSIANLEKTEEKDSEEKGPTLEEVRKAAEKLRSFFISKYTGNWKTESYSDYHNLHRSLRNPTGISLVSLLNWRVLTFIDKKLCL
jgi:hypothetical protein